MMIVVVMNCLFYILYFKVMKLITLDAQNMLQRQQIEYYYDHYNQLNDNLTKVKEFKHNSKHILLNAVGSLLPINENKEIIDKINHIINDMYIENFICYTSHPAIDMILNYQVERANKDNILIEIKTNKGLIVNCNSEVISIIIGNLLDNAYEACLKYDKKTIEFKLININDNIHISIKNQYNGTLHTASDLPITNKDDFNNHGIGLKSIQSLIERCDGLMHIETKNHNFHVQIHLVNN